MAQEILCGYHSDSVEEVVNEVSKINLANCLETKYDISDKV